MGIVSPSAMVTQSETEGSDPLDPRAPSLQSDREPDHSTSAHSCVIPENAGEFTTRRPAKASAAESERHVRPPAAEGARGCGEGVAES